MNAGMLIFITLKLFFGFLIAFLAILAWAKTREGAWIFIIAATLIRYVELIYSILSDLEVLNPDWGYAAGFPLLDVILTILPLIFLAAGFSLFLIHKRKY